MLFLRALLCATAFYVVEQLHFPFEFTVRGLNVFNILFLLIWLTLLVRGIKNAESTPYKGAFYFLFVMLVWGFIVGFFNDDSSWVADLTELKTSIFYLLLYMLYYRAVQDMRTLKIVLACLLVTAFLAQLEAVREGLDYGIGAYNETHRASGPFGNDFWRANSAAAFYVIFVPVAAVFMLALKRGTLLKAALAASVAVGVFGLFVTYSRQGYFILALIFLYMTLRRNPLIAVVLVVVLGSYQSWAPESVIQRIDMTEQTEEASGEQHFDQSTESRIVIWEGAWEMIQDHPLGVGLNHFQRNIGMYVPQYRGFDAHNNYIRMTAEASMLATVAMLAVVLCLFRLGWRVEHMDKSDTSRALGLGLQVAVLGVLLSNFYGSRFFDGDVMGNFWILAALVARYRQLRLQERAPQEQQAEAPWPGLRRLDASPVITRPALPSPQRPARP
ncbi:MAG: O-antigen ligase family protein [Burkholderiales bacterium]